MVVRDERGLVVKVCNSGRTPKPLGLKSFCMFFRRCDVDAVLVVGGLIFLPYHSMQRASHMSGCHSFSSTFAELVVGTRGCLFQSPMFSHILVIVFCCGQNSALRFTSDGMDEWFAMRRNAPIHLTSTHTRNMIISLSIRCPKQEEVCFAPKFVVALAPLTFAQCGTLYLPLVVNMNFVCACEIFASEASSCQVRCLHVLSQTGCDIVVLSETDVFFFASCVPMYRELRSRTGAHIAAMPAPKDSTRSGRAISSKFRGLSDVLRLRSPLR